MQKEIEARLVNQGILDYEQGRVVDGKTAINKLRAEQGREDFKKAFFALREEAADLPEMTFEEFNSEY